MGLWVDLTYTDRFYPRDYVENQGIQYVKVTCRGHGEAPTKEQTAQFVDICRRFTDEHPDDIIGVHCTHGFNRSGFLVCAFLSEVEDFSIESAIIHFRNLRPPGIYKQDYIDELCRIYGSPDDPASIPVAPEKPEWCLEDEDVDDDGMASGNHAPGPSSSMNGKRPFPTNDESDDGGAAQNGNANNKRKKREFFKENPTFMDGVPDVIPITDRQMLSKIQRKVQDMCGWQGYLLMFIYLTSYTPAPLLMGNFAFV